MNRGVTILLSVVAIIGFIAYLLYASLGDRYRVEACVEFKGERQCKTARAKTHAEALRTAVSNACAELTSGMTNVLACEQSSPISVRDLR